LIRAVGAVGMTVRNLERSIAFYSDILGFEKVSDVEVWGEDYERLQGVFGLRMRVVRMRLGEEAIELTTLCGADDERGRSWIAGGGSARV
jgi:catechol 2,3-dioxygenase-like lactoylglutathione lyase family enzyme